MVCGHSEENCGGKDTAAVYNAAGGMIGDEEDEPRGNSGEKLWTVKLHNRPFAASDHMVQIMLFWCAKEFDRF